LKNIINNSEKYKDAIIRRKTPELIQSLEYVVTNRPIEIELTNRINTKKHERSKLSEVMKELKNKAPIEVKEELAKAKSELKTLEAERDELSQKIHRYAESLPNLLDTTVPKDTLQGDIVKFINCASEQDAVNSMPTSKFDHKTIGEKLNIMNFNIAARISGSSWYYLVGDGALLEQALIQYGLSKARVNGYTMIIPPSIVKNEIISACGFKPNDQNGEQQVYQLTNDDLSLIGTAEIPLGAYHSSSTFPSSQNYPIKYVGISRSYRAEAGARGSDTKGLYRVHEFTKVELFHFTTPDKAAQELEDLKNLQISIIEDLGLSAKMINMPSSDLGAPALKKFDCEAWMPGREGWGELTSCSNCSDYQSRRLGIRYEDGKDENKLKYIHTLNGTCVAIPRVIVAIMEQFYDPATESIIIPKVLRPYMDDKERIYQN
jgi:seryl-tRNA synthetase